MKPKDRVGTPLPAKQVTRSRKPGSSDCAARPFLLSLSATAPASKHPTSYLHIPPGWKNLETPLEPAGVSEYGNIRKPPQKSLPERREPPGTKWALVHLPPKAALALSFLWGTFNKDTHKKKARPLPCFGSGLNKKERKRLPSAPLTSRAIPRAIPRSDPSIHLSDSSSPSPRRRPSPKIDPWSASLGALGEARGIFVFEWGWRCTPEPPAALLVFSGDGEACQSHGCCDFCATCAW